MEKRCWISWQPFGCRQTPLWTTSICLPSVPLRSSGMHPGGPLLGDNSGACFHFAALLCKTFSSERHQSKAPSFHLLQSFKLKGWVNGMRDSLAQWRKSVSLCATVTCALSVWAERCPQSHPEDQLSHVQPGPHSDLHTALPGLHWVSPPGSYSLRLWASHKVKKIKVKVKIMHWCGVC